MKDGTDETAGSDVGLHGHKPALQVICLGSGGGPSEGEVTGMIVRAKASEWARGSLLAVDAGSHLAPIVRILERDFPRISGDDSSAKANESRGSANAAHSQSLNSTLARTSLSPILSGDESEPARPEPTTLTTGPFAGLKFPNESARANALHVIRNYVSTYLITHPHLDHLSGFAINTAAFHATSRPKTVAALPSTIEAIKQHIFNDLIWPNLTDEDGGVGFVTFQRLKEGGDVMVGEGEGRGYIEVSDGLAVKPLKVSHGVCTKSPPSHRHRGSVPNIADTMHYNGSMHSDATPSMMRTNSQFSAPGTPGITPRPSFYHSNNPSPRINAVDQQSCVVDSTAFFIRDTETNREVLIFGDVEPDSISLTPRNHVVWQEAARKITHGLLTGIFIECSYDDSQADAVLFGHLNPKHLIVELQTLSSMVIDARAARHIEKGIKKRKRSGPNGVETVARHAMGDNDSKRSRSLAGRTALPKDTRRSSVPDHRISDPPPPPITTSFSGDSQQQPLLHNYPEHGQLGHHEPVSPKTVRLTSLPTQPSDSVDMPLTGVKVVVIHIKDTMKDGPHVRDNILAQLQDYEQRLQQEGHGLGCEFVISKGGEDYWF